MKVRISAKGQVCLPAVLRKRPNIAVGDVMDVFENDGSIILSPLRKKRNKDEVNDLLRRTSGMWKHMEQDGADIVRRLRQGSTRSVWRRVCC